MGQIGSCQEILFSKWFARHLYVDIQTGNDYTDFTKLICFELTLKRCLIEVKRANVNLRADLYFKTYKSQGNTAEKNPHRCRSINGEVCRTQYCSYTLCIYNVKVKW